MIWKMACTLLLCAGVTIASGIVLHAGLADLMPGGGFWITGARSFVAVLWSIRLGLDTGASLTNWALRKS